MKQNTIIFDLDGTLADITARRAYSTKPNGKIDWAKFFDPANISMDLPNMPVIAMARILADAGYEIWIFSGRSAATFDATTRWLFDNGVAYDRLIMRPTSKDMAHMPDDQLKQLWLNEHFPGDQKSRILCTYDDRDKVVAMWRANGLTCMQVNYGNF